MYTGTNYSANISHKQWRLLHNQANTSGGVDGMILSRPLLDLLSVLKRPFCTNLFLITESKGRLAFEGDTLFKCQLYYANHYKPVHKTNI
jgi:hypothetical protein